MSLHRFRPACPASTARVVLRCCLFVVHVCRYCASRGLEPLALCAGKKTRAGPMNHLSPFTSFVHAPQELPGRPAAALPGRWLRRQQQSSHGLWLGIWAAALALPPRANAM
jgi:hypothetical protein